MVPGGRRDEGQVLVSHRGKLYLNLKGVVAPEVHLGDGGVTHVTAHYSDGRGPSDPLVLRQTSVVLCHSPALERNSL